MLRIKYMQYAVSNVSKIQLDKSLDLNVLGQKVELKWPSLSPLFDNCIISFSLGN